MNCDACGDYFNDGVQCNACKKNLDFGCANITENGYRKLGPDRRAVWKCAPCRAGTLAPSPSASMANSPEPASLEKIMEKLISMELKLVDLPKLSGDIKGIKSNMSKLQDACQGAVKKVDEFAARVDTVESSVASLQASLGDYTEVRNQISTCQRNDSTRDQLSRLNNVEIKGVPLKKTENLFDIIDKIGSRIEYRVTKPQINYVSRVPSFNGREKSIIVSFLNRYVKEDFIASARTIKSLTAREIGFETSDQRIYVNDHLSPDYKKLLTHAKQLAKEKCYQYVWVKFSKIHIRKNDTSPVVTIKNMNDLNKLM